MVDCTANTPLTKEKCPYFAGCCEAYRCDEAHSQELAKHLSCACGLSLAMLKHARAEGSLRLLNVL